MRMDNINRAVALIEERDLIVEKLEKLRKMSGSYRNDAGAPKAKCSIITFESGYTASTQLHSAYFTWLNTLLVDTAIQQLEGALATIERQLGTMEKALGGDVFEL